MDFIWANDLVNKRFRFRAKKTAVTGVHPTFGAFESHATLKISRTFEDNSILVAALEMELRRHICQAISRKRALSFKPARTRKLHSQSPLCQVQLVCTPIRDHAVRVIEDPAVMHVATLFCI